MRYLLVLLLAAAAAAQQPPGASSPRREPAAPPEARGPAPPAPRQETAEHPESPEPPGRPFSAAELEQDQLRQLLALRRVYVDQLAGGEGAGEIRDMVIAALQRARLFIVTEDEARADAYLRGSAEDLIFSETHATRDGLNFRTQGRISSRAHSETDSFSTGVGVGETDDSYSRDRKHEASAAIRLVSRNGDVLWSTTQESLGAKYKGSSADVAEKISKELAAAYAHARKLLAAQEQGTRVTGAPEPGGKPGGNSGESPAQVAAKP
jgi:hypothetical protein